ncbi:hypothetical protein F4819DRAFT_447791, partial [Hypoxylon fuscum]
MTIKPNNSHDYSRSTEGFHAKQSLVMASGSLTLSVGDACDNSSAPGRKIEDYPQGYPRFAAFISAHSSFHVFRRFMALRVRLLLYKQDELSVLEKQLERLDGDEPKVLYLGSIRRDRNEARKELMTRLESKLEEYDSLATRNETILKRALPRDRDVQNLRNWIGNNACVAREEKEYLYRDGYDRDLMAVGALGSDSTQDSLEASISNALILSLKWTKWKGIDSGASIDETVHIFPPGLMINLTRGLLASMFILVLSAPVVIIVFVATIPARLAVALVACIIFILILSILAKVKTAELFVAGATYAAVMVVFITGNSMS